MTAILCGLPEARLPHFSCSATGATNDANALASASLATKSVLLPWDIIVSIVENADVAALRLLSLVCRDLFIESAPFLYRCFAANIKPTKDAIPSTLLSIQLQTQILRQHSQSHHIKHVRVTLDQAMTLRGASGAELVDHLIGLFYTIGSIKYLEGLELDIGASHAIVVGCLRSIPLPASLKELRIRSTDPLLISFGPDFWARHRSGLRTMSIIAPPGTTSQDTPSMTEEYTSLSHIHLSKLSLLRHIALPPSLRSLVIDTTSETEIEALVESLSTVPGAAAAANAVLPPMFGAVSQTTPPTPPKPTAASQLEELEIGFAGEDPLPLYTGLICRLPKLRKLRVHHCAFPSPEIRAAVCNIVSSMPLLQQVEWTLQADSHTTNEMILSLDVCSRHSALVWVPELLSPSRSLRSVGVATTPLLWSAGQIKASKKGLVYARCEPTSSWILMS